MRHSPAIGALVAMLVALLVAYGLLVWVRASAAPSPSDYRSIQEG